MKKQNRSSIAKNISPVFKLSILSTAVLLAACGGGGGGNEQPPQALETPSRDAANGEESSKKNFGTSEEYANSSGLDQINAAALYERGGTGRGQTVAVIDSGILGTHQDLDKNVSSASYDFQTGSSSLRELSGNSHGTHVAGIIASERNGIGRQGVAYDANVLSLSYLGDNYISLGELANIYQYAADNGAKVINNSWTFQDSQITNVNPEFANSSLGDNIVAKADELIRDNDNAFVWAVGNNGKDQVQTLAGLPYLFPELKPGWVAVVALNTEGSIAGFSNRCGVAAEWCLAAPGTAINSTSADGNYSTKSGSSMAAPLVSGGLAALKSAFPNLSYKQLVARVLHTANRSGIYANSEIYGQGALNLDAASSPIGQLSVTASTKSDAERFASSASIAIVPESVAAGFGMNTSETNVLLVDSFQDAPFWTSASNFIKTTQAPVMNINWDSLFSIGNEDSVTQDLGGGLGLTVRSNQSDSDDVFAQGFALTQTNNNHQYSFGSGSGEVMNQDVLAFNHEQSWLSEDSNRYLGTGFRMNQFAGSDNAALKLGFVNENPLYDAQTNDSPANRLYESNNGELSKALFAEFSYSPDAKSTQSPDFSIQLTSGTLGNVSRGLNSDGAFGLGEDARFNEVTLGYQQQTDLGNFSASIGQAQINTNNQNTFLNMPDDIGITTAKLGYDFTAQKRHLFSLDATKSIANANQDITLDLPTSFNAAGDIGMTRYSTEVGNLYDQSAVEVKYNFLLNKNMQLGVQSYWQQAGSADSDMGVIIGFEIKE